MSDHLPECWFHDPAKTPAVAVNDGWPCICEPLRACEQRVREDERDNCWSAVAWLVPTEFWANVPCSRAQWWIVKADALAAIDALKEKP